MFLLDGKVLQEGTAFADADGKQYPANWLNLSTEEEKLSVGITWVPDPVRADDRYYWNGDINTPKDLQQIKDQAVKQINRTAYTILNPTDWMVIKALEESASIPEPWSSWRASIRITASTAVEAINNCESVAQVAETVQVVWPKDPNALENNKN